ncbi:complex I NDUFA9 subunit family protein [Pelomonas sp. APW6]|uniref:Complex I NDUFA9 subunit family protein n=1 Tax=Roseateles subflavus TaxID=3053353 RepID=A0ABT7LHY6_9BURK|nr:complex I NDUFA9 subunit family protein [Pelomonas sp. APW6]MDL5032483.1 complex I NDUFA9 subunit family protein [Pelomonas sp. APW6]
MSEFLAPGPRLLILGGTGFVGRALCRQLVAAGYGRITVPTRRPAHGKSLSVLPGVTVLQADVHDDATLARLVEAADVVVNLIAILQGSEAAFEAAHVRWPQRLVRACEAAEGESGRRRILHVSALGVSEDAPSRYLRSKARGEAVIRAAGLPWHIVRPSVIFGAEDRFLNLFADLQRVFPLVPLAGADARFQPVWVEDVALALRRLIELPGTAGRVYEAAGPEERRLRELVHLAGECLSQPRPILPLPAPLAWLQAVFMECLPGEPLMSRDNLDSMRVPNVASDQLPGLHELGIAPRSVRGVLAAAPRAAQLDRWRLRSDR